MTDPFADVPVIEYPDLIRRCIAVRRPGGLHVEFGVASGYTMRYWRDLLPLDVVIYGFDSFKGLPEAWNQHPIGTFGTNERVNLANVVLIEGMFADTIAPFMAKHRGEHVSFAHLDADLYSSTITALMAMRDHVVSGTVMLFDEYFGYPTWREHEHRALTEFLDATGYRVEYLGKDGNRLGVRFGPST